MSDEFTDEKAIKTLNLLADYAEHYGNGGNPDMTIRDLALDLIDSLHTIDEPAGSIAVLSQTFGF